METRKPEVKEFLDKSRALLKDTGEPTDKFAEVLKRENTRQIKEQLATDLEPLLQRLATIEMQQTRIIELLKDKADLDLYERQIMDLLRVKLEKE